MPINATNSSKRSPDENVLFFEVERMLGLKPVGFGEGEAISSIQWNNS